MKRVVLIAVNILISLQLFSQGIGLTPNAEISVITCDPGAELYSSFGHSAFRVVDRALGIDQAYNYGTFNFKTNNFYLKFARGKLLYDLSSYPFHYFIRDYVKENRTVVEQVLNLDQNEKQALFNFLENNAKPENKSYLYDFFFDNCATKLPEVSTKVLDGNVTMDYGFADDLDHSFRNLIHLYLDDKPWGKFGIDLALGSVIDRKAEPKEYLFLPDYVMKSYESATIQRDANLLPLVKQTNLLFQSKPERNKKHIFTPLLLFSILAIIVIWITFKDQRKEKRAKWLDFTLFFATGLIGLIVLLLWFATDHTATADNFNILWAFFPNTYIAFLLLRNDIVFWLKYYLLFVLLLLLVTILLWIMRIQVFSLAVIPILLLLFMRYTFLYRLHR